MNIKGFLRRCLTLVAGLALVQMSSAEDDVLVGTREITGWTRYNNDRHITGSGGFLVYGSGGKLVFNNGAFDNDFTGGIVVRDGGCLALDNPYITGTPFGTGDITFECTGTSRVLFSLRAITVPNQVFVTGDSTLDYPVIDSADRPNSLGNDVTASGDVYLAITCADGANNLISDSYLTFKKTLNAAGSDVGASVHSMIVFEDVLTCARLLGCYGVSSAASAANGRLGGFVLKAANNAIGQVVLDGQKLVCRANGALGGASLRFEGQHACVGPASYTQYETGIVDLNGGNSGAYTQTLAWIESDARTDETPAGYGIRNTSADAGTLVITGEVGKTATACVNLNGRINLVLASTAPATFRQVLKDRTSTMTGTVAVNGGTLALAGAASFSAVQSLALGAGNVEVESTCAVRAFPALTALSIAQGGTFAVVSGAHAPFADYQVALSLAEGSVLSVPAGTTLKLRSLTVGGELLPAGEYTAAEVPQIVGGTVETSEGGTITVEPITWTGADATDGTDPYRAANWGLQANPAFGLFKYHPTFATSGSEAVFTGKNRFAGMAFSSANGFALRSRDAGTSLLVNSNVTATGSAVYSVEPPLSVVKGDEIAVGEGTELRLDGGLLMSKAMTKSGTGRLVLGGTSALDGAMTLSAGRLVFAGEENGTGSVGFNPKNGNSFVDFSNAVVHAAVTMSGGSTSSDVKVFAGTENTLYGRFTQSGSLPFGGGGKLTFRGGGHVVNGFTVKGDTEFHFCDTAWTGDYGGFYSEQGTFVFEVSGSQIGTGGALDCANRGVFRFAVDDAFVTTAPPKWQAGWGTFDLGSTVQTARELYSTKDSQGSMSTGGTVTGTEGAVLTVAGVVTNTYIGKIDGAVSLVYAGGADARLTLQNRDFASTGNVTVSGGTLAFSDATWTNAEQVVVTGGRLVLGKCNVFGRKTATLYVRDGLVELTAGTRQVFKTTYLWNAEKGDYVEVAPGEYCAGSSGLSAHLAGAGVLKTGKAGMALIVR